MEPLEVAIQMENDGKEFYLKSSENSTDGLGKSLFARLAVEEEFHAAKAREIHASLSRGETPLMIEDSLDRGTKLKSIFASATNEIGSGKKVTANELEAIRVALEMEERSRKFYDEQGREAKTEFERRFFNALKREEQGHSLSLVDYREYLTDPAGWSTKMEHHGLDGG